MTSGDGETCQQLNVNKGNDLTKRPISETMATPAKRPRQRWRKNKSAIQGPSGVKQTNAEYWRDCINCWYPKLHEKSYFCPPQQFNRVPYDITSIAGQSVLVPKIAEGGAVSSLQKTQNSLAQSTAGQPSSVMSKDSHSEFDSEVEYESEEKIESESNSDSDYEQCGYSQNAAEPSSEYQSVAKPDYVHSLSPFPIRQDFQTRSMYSQSPSHSTYAEHSPETSTSLSSYTHPPTAQMSPARDESLQSSEQMAHIPNETYALYDYAPTSHALPMYEDFAQPTFTQSSHPQTLNMQPSTHQSTQPFPHLPAEHPQWPETQQALKYQTANESMTSTQYQCREMHHVQQTKQLQQSNQVLPHLDACSHQSQKWQVSDTHNQQSANLSYEHSNEAQQSTKYEQAKHSPPIPHTHKMWKSYAGPVPTVPDCHVRDDKASQRVLACIQELSKDETQVMMVISQLQFGHYLNKPCYAATAALLPRPIDLEQKYHQGDFDLLIIHKMYGLIIFEIKSVGDNFSELQNEKSKENDILLLKVDDAIKQLNKSNHVIKHLVSDIMPNVNVIKVLVLTNVTKDQLSEAMASNHSSTSESLFRCLGVQTLVEAIGLCVLSEDLPERDTPWNMTSTIKDRFLQWWHRRVVGCGNHDKMEDAIYEQVVARFCGPATTVFIHCISTPRLELRTLGESVSETGERMSGLVLFPEQIELLNTSPPLVYLTGPPGTGKTVVLTIQGLSWLQRGHDVHVASLFLESHAASVVIAHQLNQTWSAATPKVYRHQYFSFNRRKTAITDILVHSPDKKDILCVIVDEAVCSRRNEIFMNIGLREFCEELKSQRPNLHLWAAALEHGQRPPCLLEVTFRTPLRSPPVVSREVVRSGAMKPRHVLVNRRQSIQMNIPQNRRKLEDKRVHTYITSKVPVPTDGPPVMRISHHVDTSGHLGKLPLECAECGRQVAQVLTNLFVGFGSAGNGPPPLQFRDVLVLCKKISSTDLGFACGLRENGIPVKILYFSGYDDIQELALAKNDQVTITESTNVWGLERKVIIIVGNLRRKMTGEERLYCASRCTSQLVIID